MWIDVSSVSDSRAASGYSRVTETTPTKPHGLNRVPRLIPILFSMVQMVCGFRLTRHPDLDRPSWHSPRERHAWVYLTRDSHLMSASASDIEVDVSPIKIHASLERLWGRVNLGLTYTRDVQNRLLCLDYV